jgi:hypothetical protein
VIVKNVFYSYFDSGKLVFCILMCTENMNCYASCTNKGSSLICMPLGLNVLKLLEQIWMKLYTMDLH